MSTNKIIYENDDIVVFLHQRDKKTYDLLVRDSFFNTPLKAWRIKNINNTKWVIENWQMTDNLANFFEFEFVCHPFTWESLDDLLDEFRELTSGFQYFFTFPKNEN